MHVKISTFLKVSPYTAHYHACNIPFLNNHFYTINRRVKDMWQDLGLYAQLKRHVIRPFPCACIMFKGKPGMPMAVVATDTITAFIFSILILNLLLGQSYEMYLDSQVPKAYSFY